MKFYKITPPNLIPYYIWTLDVINFLKKKNRKYKSIEKIEQ